MTDRQIRLVFRALKFIVYWVARQAGDNVLQNARALIEDLDKEK